MWVRERGKRVFGLGFWFGLMSESVSLLVREVEDVGVQTHVEDEEEDEGRADDGGHVVVAQGT